MDDRLKAITSDFEHFVAALTAAVAANEMTKEDASRDALDRAYFLVGDEIIMSDANGLFDELKA